MMFVTTEKVRCFSRPLLLQGDRRGDIRQDKDLLFLADFLFLLERSFRLWAVRLLIGK
ncbi:MAG: hypothetical protein WAU28_03010 [Candidatus Moraniibacteriota bacterium]